MAKTLRIGQIFIVTATVGLSGCASIVEGTSQTVSVELQPASAHCTVHRKDQLLHEVKGAVSVIKLDKSRHPLILACSAPGYQDRKETITADPSRWGVVGAIALDFGAVDYATGALNKYPDQISIKLDPLPAGS
jgi:hypothetical protein